MSNEKEQFERFENLIERAFGKSGVRCVDCPIRQECETEMAQIKNDKDLDKCPTCEETLWHYIKTGEFLK